MIPKLIYHPLRLIPFVYKIVMALHGPKNLTFQFTPVTHMVYLEIQLLEVNFSMAKSK